MSWLLAIAAGGLGALARYGVSGWVQQRLGTGAPVGTSVVNVTGAAALGFVLGAGWLSDPSSRVAASGFLAAYTTFSTWMVETVLLGEAGGRSGWRTAATNLAAPLALGLGAAAACYALGQWIG